jgi:hypothetical protein
VVKKMLVTMMEGKGRGVIGKHRMLYCPIVHQPLLAARQFFRGDTVEEAHCIYLTAAEAKEVNKTILGKCFLCSLF